MNNTLEDDLQSSSSGNDKNDEDSFLNLSTKIVTFPSTPSVCYFQMVELDKAHQSRQSSTPESDEKPLSLKEKWQQSKFKKLVRYKYVNFIISRTPLT